MAIKLMVASYNNGGSDWNAEAEETNFLSYTIDQQFKVPAVTRIRIADPTGAMAQKYNADANDVYIGVGKATIEDPVGTDVFYGRIVKAEHDSKASILTLTCRDWLDQLNDEVVDYDMREDLDGAGLRQSELKTDADSAVYIGPTYSTYSAIGGAVLDDGGVFASDTTDANDADANDVAIFPAVPALNDAFLFGCSYRVHGIRLNIGTAGVYDTVTVTWYYSTGAGAWTAISVTDGTNSFQNAGTNNVTWIPPADWATAAYDGITKYWVKAKITAMVSITTVPLGTQFWELCYNAFDDDMSWANDALNDKYLQFTAGLAGKVTVETGAYTVTNAPSDGAESGALANTWVDDDTYYQYGAGPDMHEDWTETFGFRVLVEEGSLYSSGPVSATVHLVVLYMYIVGTGLLSYVQVYDNNAAAYVTVGKIDNSQDQLYYRYELKVPENILPYLLDANGVMLVRLTADNDAAAAVLIVKYVRVVLTYNTQGYTTNVLITDTVNPNRLFVDTDLTIAGPGVWDGAPYSVADHIHSHVNTIVTAGDAQVALTTSVESTTGVSIEHFEGKTRLDILQELAEQDNAVFWLILGGTVVQWKRTTDSTSTALADSGVLRWMPSGYDFDRVFNKYTVRGIRIGTGQVEGTDSDATSIAKFKTTKSKILSGRWLSDAEATSVAQALVDRDANPNFNLQAELAGLSSIRLGDYIAVTSTYLNLTAVAYTVTGWSYDSKTYRTTITLEPRVTVGHQLQPLSFPAALQQAQGKERQERGDRYLPDLTTHVVS